MTLAIGKLNEKIEKHNKKIEAGEEKGVSSGRRTRAR